MATKNVLGRISAIVSVNTASVRPTLNASVKDVEKFASSINSRIRSAAAGAGRSFNDIFTPLQKLQAALKAANQQPVNLKIQNSREILQAVQAAEQIAKPLTDARKQFSGLSQEVQATLLPVLQAAQKQTTQLFDALSNGAKVSDRDLANTESRVRQLTASLARASEASSLTRGLATGQEVQFQNPEFVEQARRAAQLQQQAASLTPTQLGGSSIVGLIGEQRAAADEAERLRAALDKVRTTRNGDAQAAQAAYSNQLAQLAQINNRIELQIDLINRSAAAIRSAPQRQADNEIALLIRREQAAKEIEDQRQTAAQRVADNEIAQLIRREQAAKQIEQQRLAGLERVADNEIALLIRREQAAKEAEDRRLAAATRAADNEIAALIRREQAARRAATGGLDFGLDLDAPARQIEVLRGSVVSLKGQLDTLPAGIRAQFIPAIQQAEANLRALEASPAATAAELTRARREIERLSQAATRAQQSLNIQSFRGFTETLATRGAIGELQALQGILARIQAQAGGPAAQAYDRYAAALRRAVRDGTTQLPEVRRRLQELQVSAARAAAATGRISFRRALDEIRRGGDVARGGFDRLSLAAQQAAFAIDDFFSVQGDFTQRIRAVQNNITQLAFIIGGTRGLFIGLGVAIAAQATVALINWINNGRTAEDQTKALNDALARQKSLVEELAQAFESLGDSIARRAFSDSAQEARAFRKELDDIAKKQRELNEARVADLDVNVQRERAQQNQIRGELESATDAGQRVALTRQLEESRQRERQAAEAAVRRTVRGQEVADAIAASFQQQINALGGAGRASGVSDRLAREGNEAVSRVGLGTSLEDIQSQRNELEREIRRRQARAASGNPQDAAIVAELQSLLNSLELPLQNALNELSRNIIQSSLGAALAIEQAQNDVADAIQRGVAGAADFQAALDNTARQLEEEERRLADAQEIRDPAERERQIRIAEGNIRDIRNRQDVINEQSRQLRLTTGRGGERTTAALSALQGNERFANEYGRLTARLRDAVDAEFAARNALAQATANGNEAAKARARADLDAANAASDLAASVAEAALAMEEALSRIRKIGDDALSASTSIADDAQRRFTQDPTEANRRDRDAAERQLIQDRERVARANNALDRARSEAELGDPRILAINDEIRKIQDERTRIGDLSAQDRTAEDARRAEELANREAQLQAERAQRLNELTQAERAQQDAIAQEIDSRRRLIEQIERERAFDEQVARRRDPEGDAVRGLDLFDTPAQRAAREAEQGILDIAAAFDEQIRGLLDENGGLPNADILAQSDELRRQRDQAAAQFAEQQQRAAAPAIFNLADSVENAILQGPSRAALNASDISTQEGARELNRLLRGEDSARDQNLVELQKQSQELQLVNQRLAEVARQVGVAL